MDSYYVFKPIFESPKMTNEEKRSRNQSTILGMNKINWINNLDRLAVINKSSTVTFYKSIRMFLQFTNRRAPSFFSDGFVTAGSVFDLFKRIKQTYRASTTQECYHRKLIGWLQGFQLRCTYKGIFNRKKLVEWTHSSDFELLSLRCVALVMIKKYRNTYYKSKPRNSIRVALKCIIISRQKCTRYLATTRSSGHDFENKNKAGCKA